jgi:hypothetical protein
VWSSAATEWQAREAGDRLLTRARQETRFLLSSTRAPALVRALSAELVPHRYAGRGANRLPLARHYTTTIYFDTRDRALYRAAGERAHVKLRAREYYDLHPELTEVATDPAQLVRYQPILWLELKLRDGERTEKRRVGIPKREVPEFLAAGGASGEMLASRHAGAAGDENDVIAAVQSFVACFSDGLAASCLVNYRRAAWQSADGDLRVTLDRDIAAFAPPAELWSRRTPLVRETLGNPLHEPRDCVVEVKSRSTRPAWLDRVLAEAGARCASYSKFRTASAAVHGA